MPVVIDEVVITVHVGPTARDPAPGAAASQEETVRALVSECVERVLEILTHKSER